MSAESEQASYKYRRLNKLLSETNLLEEPNRQQQFVCFCIVRGIEEKDSLKKFAICPFFLFF